jgi:branched-chain amino acid transport system substrate-binding protein
MLSSLLKRAVPLVLLALIVPEFGSAAGEPYQINVILPLTGPAAFVGASTKEALEAGERAVNATGGIRGRSLHLAFLDDQTSPQVAVQLTNQILATKPAVFIGSEIVAMCNAQAPLVAKNGPVMYCLSPGAHPDPGSYEFSAGISTKDLWVALVRYLRLSGLNQIAMITPTDASGQDADRGLDGAVARAENAGVKIVAREHFNPSDISVTAQMTRIAAAKPNVVIGWAAGTPFGTVLKAFNDSGLKTPVVTTTANLSWPMIAQFGTILPPKLLFPAYPGSPDTSMLHLEPAIQQAKAAYHRSLAEINVKADNGTDVAWDPLMIIVSALRSLGPNATADQIHNYIANLRNYAGANGNYNFPQTPQRGLDFGNAIVAEWDPVRQEFVCVSHFGGVPLEKTMK